jgi:uncharacterized protein DUF3606
MASRILLRATFGERRPAHEQRDLGISKSSMRTESWLYGKAHKKAPRRRSKTHMEEAREVKSWTRKLGVSREGLRKVVEKVGNSAAEVRKELDQSGL